MTAEKEIRIFEASTVLQAIKDMLKEGFLPMSYEEVYKWKITNKDDRWLDTGTLVYKGKIKTMTRKDLLNIEEIYNNYGRLLFVGNYFHLILGGLDSLDGGGRFVGVSVKKKVVR